MKLAGLFGFYKNHQTDAFSLLFGSINFSRVSAPIVYNFMDLVGVKGSAFDKVMGQSDIVPVVGNASTFFFPLILVILILFNFFDIYKKILTSLGLKQFDFSEEFEDEGIDQGKQLIARDRKKREKEFTELKVKGLTKVKGYHAQSVIRNELEESPQKNQSSIYSSTSSVMTTASNRSNNPSKFKNQSELKGIQGKYIKNFDMIMDI